MMIEILWAGRHLIAVLALAGVVTTGAIHYQNLKATVENQEHTIRGMKTMLLQQAADMEQQQLATEVLNDRVAQFMEEVENLNIIKNEVINAPPEDDGPIAPVLRNTLGRL